MYCSYAVQRNVAKIMPRPKPPSFGCSGLNCDTLPALRMDPQMTRKIRDQFYLYYSVDSAILFLHIVTPRAAALTSTSFLCCTYPGRSLTCFTGNVPRAAANTPSEQIKVISTQTLEREREALCTQFDHLQKWARAGALSRYFIRRNMSAIICENTF